MCFVDVRSTKSTLASRRGIGASSCQAELLLCFIRTGPSIPRVLRDGRIQLLQSSECSGDDTYVLIKAPDSEQIPTLNPKHTKHITVITKRFKSLISSIKISALSVSLVVTSLVGNKNPRFISVLKANEIMAPRSQISLTQWIENFLRHVSRSEVLIKRCPN